MLVMPPCFTTPTVRSLAASLMSFSALASSVLTFWIASAFSSLVKLSLDWMVDVLLAAACRTSARAAGLLTGVCGTSWIAWSPWLSSAPTCWLVVAWLIFWSASVMAWSTNPIALSFSSLVKRLFWRISLRLFSAAVPKVWLAAALILDSVPMARIFSTPVSFAFWTLSFVFWRWTLNLASSKTWSNFLLSSTRSSSVKLGAVWICWRLVCASSVRLLMASRFLVAVREKLWRPETP